jgi:hypothetical protein
MNNERMNKVVRRFMALLLTGACLLLPVLPAAAQEEDPLATAVLLPGAVAWFLVALAIVLIIALRLWMRGR